MKSPVLVLFSGGKDSFITACRIITRGDTVSLFSCSNGAIRNAKLLEQGARRLQENYNENLVDYLGCYRTNGIIMRLKSTWEDMPWGELGSKWPDLVNNQVVCLHCQTAMWIAAITYAYSHGLHKIAAGYKKSDEFCTGQPEYIDRIKALAAKYNCQIELPVWDDTKWANSPGGIKRDLELEFHGFEPRVNEPSCSIGWPATGLTTASKHQMLDYFDTILKDIAEKEIANLAGSFKHMLWPLRKSEANGAHR